MFLCVCERHVTLSCPGDAEAQRPAARAARSRLQLRLHAHACSSHYTLNVQQACCTLRDPFRDEISEVGRGLSLADTQTGRYVRLYSRRRLGARRSSRRTSAPLDPSSTSFQNAIVLTTKSLVPIPVPVCRLEQMPIAGAHSREHCPRVYAICRPELG